MAEDAENQDVISFDAEAEYRFADAVYVCEARAVVYLDFLQFGTDKSAEGAQSIARLVVTPKLAAGLVEKLSALHDA